MSGPLLVESLYAGSTEFVEGTWHIAIAYADDLLLLIFGPTRKSLEDEAQRALSLVSNWSQAHNIAISRDKSLVLHLRKPHFLRRPPIFRLNNATIKATTALPYLGLILDPTLSFLPHLRAKKQELDSIILEPKLRYASSIWYPKLQYSHGHRLLSSIQTNSFLLISGAYKKSATIALSVLTCSPPLTLKCFQSATQGRVLRLQESCENFKPCDYQRKGRASRICPYKNCFYWSYDSSHKTDIEIYTDGSRTEEGTAYAYCVYENSLPIHSQQTILNSNNSIFQAELLAIADAIDWSNNSTYLYIKILSDSLSGLQAILTQPIQ